MHYSSGTGGGPIQNYDLSPENNIELNRLLRTVNALLENSRIGVHVTVNQSGSFVQTREVDNVGSKVTMETVEQSELYSSKKAENVILMPNGKRLVRYKYHRHYVVEA